MKRRPFSVSETACVLFIAALAVLIALACPALAERIVTKTGETFTGTIIEQDDAQVVLRTMSGTMKIPRSTIEKIEKDESTTPGGQPAPTVTIVPVTVEPAKAATAIADAKAALVAGEWAKAGGLLEGVVALPSDVVKAEDRLAATRALVTCYLQVKDPQGTSRTLMRLSNLVTDANDRRRLAAAGEALRTLNSTEVGGKALGRFEEVVEATMQWKAQQCLEDAMDTASKATRLNDMAQLDKAASQAVKKLQDADVYVPGFSGQNQEKVLDSIIENIMAGARKALDYCKEKRPILAQTRLSSIASKALAIQWNSIGKPYLDGRIQAEMALKNLQPFTQRHNVPALYTKNATEVKQLLADLDEYQYYPVGTSTGYGYYGYSDPSRRLKIQLRSF